MLEKDRSTKGSANPEDSFSQPDSARELLSELEQVTGTNLHEEPSEQVPTIPPDLESRSSTTSSTTSQPERLYCLQRLEKGETLTFGTSSYTVHSLLGGNEGQTCLATDEQDNKKVVKVISKTQYYGDSNERWDRLDARLRKVNTALGSNIEFHVLNPVEVVIINDYVEGQTIDEYISSKRKNFSEEEIIDCLVQILDNGLPALHKEGLVHKDIKPSNIIIDGEGEYHLIDFAMSLKEIGSGLQTVTSSVSATPAYGTLDFEKQPDDDLYALAKTACFMRTGNDPEAVYEESMRESYDKELVSSLPVSIDLKDVLTRMLGYTVTKKGKFRRKKKLKPYKTCSDALDDLLTLQGKSVVQNTKHSDKPLFDYSFQDLAQETSYYLSSHKRNKTDKKEHPLLLDLAVTTAFSLGFGVIAGAGCYILGVSESLHFVSSVFAGGCAGGIPIGQAVNRGKSAFNKETFGGILLANSVAHGTFALTYSALKTYFG